MSKKKITLMKLVFHFAPYFKSVNNSIDLRRELFAYNYLRKYKKYAGNSEYVQEGNNLSVKMDKTIWVYWKQGLSNAPLLVQKCVKSIQEHAGEFDVIILNEKNISRYIRMPYFIEKKHDEGNISEAHYSDLLRISLLIQYGGVWCDSTCYMTESLPDYVRDADLFLFQQTKLNGWMSPSKFSNWFIKANKNNNVLVALRNVLFHYWKIKSEACHYYIFHFLLSIIVEEISELNKAWKNIPYVCNMNPHIFQFSFFDIYTSERYSQILKSCFIHKLTYKLNADNVKRDNNIINHFINN